MLQVALTVVVLLAWGRFLIANILAAPRTAAQMQAKEGIPLLVAQRRTTILVVLWIVASSVGLVAALVLIW